MLNNRNCITVAACDE